MSEVATRDTRSPAQILTAQVRSDEFKEQVAMALPENMPASRFQRATVTALLQKPDLADVDRDSFFFSLLKCAADGLLPDGREAALVPYKGKCSYLPMIGGYRKIAGEHGWTIETVVVHAKDDFSYSLGLEPRIDHKPAPINTDRGELVAAYAIGRHRDGRRVIEVYEAAAVAAAKGVAQTDRVWKQWPAQMWEKTVGKRLFAKLPLDPADKRVAGLMVDAQEIGPAASAEMLYGPGGQTFAAREIEQATPEATPADDGGANIEPSAPVDQQAAGEHSSGAEPPAPPAAPGPGFQIPDSVLDAAAAHVVVHTDPKSGWNGRTLASIAEDQEYGAKWLTWACGSDGDVYLDEPTVAAVRLLVEHRHPQIWAQVTGGAA